MKNILRFLILLILSGLICWSSFAAEETYLSEKSDDGSILILADGSVWQVAPADTVDSSLWLPMEDIIIPDTEDCLINKDNGEKVDARRIR
jgi:hypothetical protein